MMRQFLLSRSRKLVEKLSAQRGIQIDYTLLPGADHFFTGKLDEMMGVVDAYLDDNLSEDFKRAHNSR